MYLWTPFEYQYFKLLCCLRISVILPLNVEESHNLNHQEPHFIHLDHQGLWGYHHQIQSAQYLVAYVNFQPSFPLRISSNIKEKIKANNTYSMYRITNKRENINQINEKIRILICPRRFRSCLLRLFENRTSLLMKVQVGMEH